jgi:hypothetical protein
MNSCVARNSSSNAADNLRIAATSCLQLTSKYANRMHLVVLSHPDSCNSKHKSTAADGDVTTRIKHVVVVVVVDLLDNADSSAWTGLLERAIVAACVCGEV